MTHYITVKSNASGPAIVIDRMCAKCGGTGRRPDTFSRECIDYDGYDGNCFASGEKIRKNGTCSHHACYWCDGTPKLSPRQAFMQYVNQQIDALDSQDAPADSIGYVTLRQFVVEYGESVSTSEKWRRAVSWYDQRDDSPRWVLVQGSVYLSYAL